MTMILSIPQLMHNSFIYKRDKFVESPDLNPIENVWASLKYYLRNEHKPTNLETLEQGIKNFWKLMTPDCCTKYISHLNKVMPVVILTRI